MAFPDLILPPSLAVWDPLGGTNEPAMTGHDGIVWHTMAGSFAGTDAWVHQNGWSGTEGTVGIAGSGYCKQWVSWGRQADHALQGNSRWVGMEFADAGEMFPPLSTATDWSPPYTAAQLERGIQLCVYWCRKESHAQCPSTWRCHREGIPARFIANSCERGIGCHYHGIDGRGLVDGCPRWSTSRGKICPRMIRFNQVRDIAVPEIARRLRGTVTPPPLLLEDVDMPFEIYDGKRVRGVVGGLVGYRNATERGQLRKAFADAKVPFPVVRVTADWFDTISNATSIHGVTKSLVEAMHGYWMVSKTTGTKFYVTADHTQRIPPGPLQDWVGALMALSGIKRPTVPSDDALINSIPLVA